MVRSSVNVGTNDVVIVGLKVDVGETVVDGREVEVNVDVSVVVEVGTDVIVTLDVRVSI